MFVVSTTPHFVLTLVPSTIGRMSLWTPSRDTSPRFAPLLPVILSISSMKIMPICSVRTLASSTTFSLSTAFAVSSSRMISRARCMVMRLLRGFWKIEPMLFIASWMSSMELPVPMTPISTRDAGETTISTILSSKTPLWSISRNCSRVESSLDWTDSAPASFFTWGRSRSRSLSSTALPTSASLRRANSSETIVTALAMRSLTIDSTSRPT